MLVVEIAICIIARAAVKTVVRIVDIGVPLVPEPLETPFLFFVAPLRRGNEPGLMVMHRRGR
ncbi:hypothetical protein GCM10009733_006180 [Nonomuraea maheshkhaliensis]|uniref:Uncharacterized protein n=1 Tax=Nonomuraea maheshkhaliensis TaxID=419590 RepID=A0ABN2ENK0_9ACTN